MCVFRCVSESASLCLRPCAWPLNYSNPVLRKVPRPLSQELGVQVCELCVCRSVGYKRQPITCCLWGSRKEHAESSQPMRCQSWRRSPPQETLGGVSGVQIINRLPNRHSWLFSLLIYPFLSLFFGFSFFVNTSLQLQFHSSAFCFHASTHNNSYGSESLTWFFLPWVHSTVYPSLHVGWKLWWYIILYCHCHVRRHVCSFGKEEEVDCTELQTKHQDVYSGTKGHHVSSDIILTAGSDTAFLASLFFHSFRTCHWTRLHQTESGDRLWDSFEVETISLVGFCVYQVADIWYLVVLLNDLEYHRWSQVCKTTQVRVSFVPSLLAALWSGCYNNRMEFELAFSAAWNG